MYFWQLFPYRIILRTCQSFEGPGSTWAGGRHKALGDFFGQNSILNNFYWKLFLKCNFPFHYRIILQICQSFKPRSSTLGRDWHMRSCTFLDKIQFWITFIWNLFLIRYIFLAELSHKLNVIFQVSTYIKREFSNPTDISTENVTLCYGFMGLAELNYLCIYSLYYFDVKTDMVIRLHSH